MPSEGGISLREKSALDPHPPLYSRPPVQTVSLSEPIISHSHLRDRERERERETDRPREKLRGGFLLE